MKRLILTLFFLVFVSNSSLAQEIRAAADSVSEPVRKTAQTITPDTYTGRQILVGNGGGFTGFTTTYYLLENGKLFRRRSRDTTFTLVSQQSTAKTKSLFSTLEGICKIKKTSFNTLAMCTSLFNGRKANRATE